MLNGQLTYVRQNTCLTIVSFSIMDQRLADFNNYFAVFHIEHSDVAHFSWYAHLL